jgi:hypothetical protein
VITVCDLVIEDIKSDELSAQTLSLNESRLIQDKRIENQADL